MSTDTNSGMTVFEIIGVVIAIILSWTANHSVFWAIVHGILAWIYVIYYVIFK